ncbi:MAG: glutamine-hydrolyzing carbamoyl-phosphate synthase small subunit [Brumimicrobium sp.]|nr:glutamine-hydrolyzing carbamoyl-phosphate synthase small subunit [Brumimicrobium sp.]
MSERLDAVLLLEDGTVFHGKSVGVTGKTFGEIVFNTAMDGYQEVFTDPANLGQIIVMSTSHVGNYGTTPEDASSDHVQCAGIVVKKFSEVTSRDRANLSLEELFVNDHKMGICDIDTRALVRHLCNHGSMNAVISSEENVSIEGLLSELQSFPKMKGMELASRVSTQESYISKSLTDKALYKIALVDFGSKNGVVHRFNLNNCEVKVFPMNSKLEEMLNYLPDGFVLSAGPGDPSAMSTSVDLVKNIIETKKPVFGINLGHQLIALSQGVSIEKMPHGHRGVNHPIINHRTGKGEMTCQNHSFVVNRVSAEDNSNIEITHSHLNDNTVAGIALKDRPVFSVQYHPEGAVGPHDSLYLISEFLELMQKNK